MVLATGGFPNDVPRRKELFPKTPTGREHWTLAPKETTGDGISLAQSVGARLQHRCGVRGRMVPGLAGAVPQRPDRHVPAHHGPRQARQHRRTANGKRFVNEANGYYDYVTATDRRRPPRASGAVLADRRHRFVRKYPLGMAKPLPVPLFPYLRSGYLKKGRTIEELASNCGIDPTPCGTPWRAFNDNARHGVDPDFGRGDSEFNRYGGDPRTRSRTRPCAPLEKAPFYAVKVVPGSFGTFAGLDADAARRVLNDDGAAHPGAVCRRQRPGHRSWAATTLPAASTSAPH